MKIDKPLPHLDWNTPEGDNIYDAIEPEVLFKAMQALIIAGHLDKVLSLATQHGWAARSWRSRAGLGVRLFRQNDGTVLIDSVGVVKLATRVDLQ
jgi:hypothetical protein